MGFRFRVLNSIAITSVGVFDHENDGLVEPHIVRLWTVDGSELMSVTVPAGMTATLVDRFRYVNITPMTLAAGGEYIIAASNFGQTSDHYLSHSAVPQNSSRLTLYESRYAYTPTGELAFPTMPFFPAPTHFGANFMFTPVPEPSSLVVMSVAVAMLFARRSVHRPVWP
jgi:hypothetical protein